MRQRSPGVNAELSLAWLLDPLSVQTFLDEMWAKDASPRQPGQPGILRFPAAWTGGD